jgi:hypothetical protein
MNETRKHYPKLKEPHMKAHILYDCIYIKGSQQTNPGRQKYISGSQGIEGGGRE